MLSHSLFKKYEFNLIILATKKHSKKRRIGAQIRLRLRSVGTEIEFYSMMESKQTNHKHKFSKKQIAALFI